MKVKHYVFFFIVYAIFSSVITIMAVITQDWEKAVAMYVLFLPITFLIALIYCLYDLEKYINERLDKIEKANKESQDEQNRKRK